MFKKNNMNNGIYYDISDKDYFAIDRPSFSSIKYLFNGYFDSIEKKQDTTSMNFGRLLHLKVLQPELFDSQVVGLPDLLKDFKRNLEEIGLDIKGINSWEKAQELLISTQKEKKEVVFAKQNDFDRVDTMYKRMQAQGLLDYFRGGKSEVVVLWTDKDTGIDFKGKLDFVAGDNSIIDLKTTTQPIQDRKLDFACINYNYHDQLMFYCMGLQQNNISTDTLRLVFVNTDTGEGAIKTMTESMFDYCLGRYTYITKRYKDLIEGRLKPYTNKFDLGYTLDFKYNDNADINTNDIF